MFNRADCAASCCRNQNHGTGLWLKSAQRCWWSLIAPGGAFAQVFATATGKAAGARRPESANTSVGFGSVSPTINSMMWRGVRELGRWCRAVAKLCPAWYFVDVALVSRSAIGTASAWRIETDRWPGGRQWGSFTRPFMWLAKAGAIAAKGAQEGEHAARHSARTSRWRPACLKAELQRQAARKGAPAGHCIGIMPPHHRPARWRRALRSYKGFQLIEAAG